MEREIEHSPYFSDIHTQTKKKKKKKKKRKKFQIVVPVF